MKKVICTGATGQDGSYMVEYLLKNTDNTVICAVRRTSQAILTNLKNVLDNPRVKLVTVDLCDGEAIRSLIREEKPDYFINFGAQTFVSDSWKNPVAHMQTNAISLIYILEAVREYVPHCRVYSSGSSEQFGDVKYSPQDEKHPYSPRSIYGVSKCTAAMICKVYRESYGLYIVHGICFNHEGIRRQEYFVSRKITKGVARISKAIKEDKSFECLELGNIDSVRDWSDAQDIVDGAWKMLNQEMYRSIRTNASLGSDEKNPSRSILYEYILSSGEIHTVREFVEKAFEVAGFPIERIQWIRTEPGNPESEQLRLVPEGISPRGGIVRLGPCLVRINPIFYRPADVEILHGDSSRARAELGWSPQVSFDQLVTRMVKHDLAEVGLS